MQAVRLFIFMLVTIFAVTNAHAVGLVAKDVQGFIEVMQELKPLFNQYADEVGDDGDASSTAQLMSDWVSGLRAQKNIEVVLKNHGLDFFAWENLAGQVTQAYIAVKLSHNGQDIRGQMRQSLAEIAANPDLPAEYKAQLLEQMQENITQFETIVSASAEDQAVVQPFLPQIDAIFDWQE